jgi:hypothetical protein
MADVLKLRLGAKVLVDQQQVGVLARFLIDNETFTLTHLDVAEHRRGRLVPLGDVASAGETVELSCTREQFNELPPDEEIEDVAPPLPTYDPSALIQAPLLAGVGRGAFVPLISSIRVRVLPQGDVDLDRHVPVHATDGHVGHTDGLVASTDGRLTHLLLGEGHIFGKLEVAVPIDDVASVGEEGVLLRISRDEVEALANR